MRTNRGEILRRRIEAGHGQSALAALAGISGPYLCQIEAGQRQGTPETLKAIADALECTVADLIEAPVEDVAS